MNAFKTPVSCSVYRSPRRDFTYLYVPADTDFDDLPKALLDAFGTPEFVLSVELTAERELAQEDARTVLQNIAAQGYHLQMPPGEDQGDLL
ncbi:MAG: YcgL domain-containing protein [Xanthomonadales bacterium]|nr:YcgL domain-containing protein [Xanthomonadales bacterium]